MTVGNHISHALTSPCNCIRAMINVGEQENSTAVQFLKGRGVTKDSVYAQVHHMHHASLVLLCNVGTLSSSSVFFITFSFIHSSKYTCPSKEWRLLTRDMLFVFVIITIA